MLFADTIAPNVTYSLISSNPNTTLARAGDVVTVTVAATEAIRALTVTCNGTSYTVYSVGSGSVNYTANHTVLSTDLNTALVCILSFTDLAGNVGQQYIDPAKPAGVTVGW